MIEIFFWILVVHALYISVGMYYLFTDYIDWMYENAIESETPPSIYKKLALETIYWWPPLAIGDLKVFLHNRKIARERKQRLQSKGF